MQSSSPRMLAQDLDKIRQQILQELSKRQLNLFFGSASDEESFPTVFWEKADEPEDRALIRYKGRPYLLQLYWIKDGVRFCCQIAATWAKDFIDSLTKAEKEEYGRSSIRPTFPLAPFQTPAFPKEFKSKKPEESADEFFRFLRSEFPDFQAQHIYDYRELLRTFFRSKGIDEWSLDPSAKIFYVKVEREIQSRIEKELEAKQRNTLEEERKKLPKLIPACVEWAAKNNLRKVGSVNLHTFLLEQGESLSSTTVGMLTQAVNQQLPKRWHEAEKKELPDLIVLCVTQARKSGMTKVTKAIVKSYLAENGRELSAGSIEILLREINRNLSDF